MGGRITRYCLSVRPSVCPILTVNSKIEKIGNYTAFKLKDCRACDYVYIDYVRRSISSSCRLLRPVNRRGWRREQELAEEYGGQKVED